MALGGSGMQLRLIDFSGSYLQVATSGQPRRLTLGTIAGWSLPFSSDVGSHYTPKLFDWHKRLVQASPLLATG
jgi:hypothetical protein